MRFMLVESLEAGMKLGRDIIFGKEAFMLHKGMPLTETYIKRLKNGGYYGVYVSDTFSEDVKYEESIDQRLFLKGVAAVEAEDIGSIMNVATQIISEITSKEKVGLDLYDLRAFDEYTFYHSVNVAIYSVVVGKRLKLSEEELNTLALAALTHDLGKKKIPEGILNKPGRLTDEEFEEIKKHPKYAYEFLYNKPGISSNIRQTVMCHHENENGSGYPYGKSGDEIPYLARIIHAVDVYDALTSKRSYKEPYAPADAFEYLIGGKNILFNEKIVDTMLQVIPMYMPGTEVLLSNDERALVVEHSADAKRPIIKLFDGGKLINLELDSDYEEVFIVKSGVILEDSAKSVETLNENRGSQNAPKETIIVVDDSLMSLISARRALEGEYNVCTMSSGVDAICYIKDHGYPDLIIMDIEMPGLNGIDTIKTLQKNNDLSVPVMFFTSTCSKEVVMKCKELGAVDYILKPIQPVYLLERAGRALKKYIEE